MVTRREFLQDGVLVTGGLAAEKLLVEVLTPVTSHADVDAVMAQSVFLDRKSTRLNSSH